LSRVRTDWYIDVDDVYQVEATVAGELPAEQKNLCDRENSAGVAHARQGWRLRGILASGHGSRSAWRKLRQSPGRDRLCQSNRTSLGATGSGFLRNPSAT
jgi:hypothetical protein